ncbi:MAG: hypothetical protein VX738_15805 [Planctomycetota bacterium]|nr:hypothetical protein [Planctomycetota bacterium]
MSRKRNYTSQLGGLDSFQDIVANLVGILIILVIIVMVRTREAIVDAKTAEIPKVAVMDVSRAKGEATAMEVAIHELEEVSTRQEIEIRYRQSERDKLQQLVVAVQTGLEQAESELSADSQRSTALMVQFTALEEELGDVIRSRQVLDNMQQQINVIDHIPTPMAKTVFGDEIHFRLEQGRISYVPFEQLISRMKEDVQKHIQQLRTEKTIIRTIGPVEGFHLRYQIGYVSQIVRTNMGPRRQERVELIKLEMLPVDAQRGEPLDVALGTGSRFLQYVQRLVPDTATVTIWVYPDSFAAFRKIKDTLRPLGYDCAGRPLPVGMPISASPHGTRSVSQ